MRYDADSIVILPGLEAVRRRPAMYVGSTGPDGVFHLVMEVVQNAVDEALTGSCTAISVVVDDDGTVTVEDDGRGIPTEPHPQSGRPTLEVVVTELHAGGKFQSGAYGVTGGLHGVGLTCVNALSASLTLTVWRAGLRHELRCAQGRVLGASTPAPEADRRGTQVRFRPDPAIFTEGIGLDVETLTRYVQEQAYLHPGLRVSLRTPGADEAVYRFETGIAGFVAHLAAQRVPAHPSPLHLRGRFEGLEVEAALQWTHDYSEELLSYVNSIGTTQGGTHVEGLRAALTRAVNEAAAAAGLLNEANGEHIAGYDVREGLVAVLSVRMSEPEFEGQTKTVLTSRSATRAVEAVISAALRERLSADPALRNTIVGKALEAGRARSAARRASERARYRTVDSIVSKEVYRQQFGIRSKNWHDSARWLTDPTILSTHAELCRQGPDAQVLDVCCGSGVVGASFRGRVGHITGLDLTPEMITLARTRLDEVVQGDVYDIPFPADRFDIVCNREVLHLLPRPEKPVSEVFRVLKPGGQFIVGQMVPYGEGDAAWFFRVVKKKQPLFFNNLMEADMRRLLEEAGFVDIVMREVFQWEDIDLWINTHETPNLMRHEIRDLYHHAPAEARLVHPFEISAAGHIRDQWRWCIFSATKPSPR
jgi:DNA gyrase subunit B